MSMLGSATYYFEITGINFAKDHCEKKWKKLGEVNSENVFFNKLGEFYFGTKFQ